MKTYSGIDLHSSNNYTGVIDYKDQRLYRKRDCPTDWMLPWPPLNHLKTAWRV